MATNIRLRTPGDLLGMVPYLIGFHPDDSLVAIGLKDSIIDFQMRADLPTGPDTVPVARRCARVIARQGADSTVLIGYGPAGRVTRAVLALADRCAAHRLPVRDILRVDGGRYWSYLCGSTACCPAEGRTFDPVAGPAAAAAVVAGRVALPSRAELERQLAPVTGAPRAAIATATRRAGRRLAALIDPAAARPPGLDPAGDPSAAGPLVSIPAPAGEPPAPEGGRRAAGEPATPPALAGPPDAEHPPLSDLPLWFGAGGATVPGSGAGRALHRAGRRAVDAAMAHSRADGRLDDDELAWLSVVLAYPPVREYARRRTGRGPQHGVGLWTDVTRRADATLVAAPAALLGYAALLLGRGPVARIAVERALAADPHYPMALLLASALAEGIPPEGLATIRSGWV